MKSASMDFFPEVVSIVLLRDDDLVTRESLSDIWKEIRTSMSTVLSHIQKQIKIVELFCTHPTFSTSVVHLKFFISILFISIKSQIFSIYFMIYHLFKHFAQAQLKSAMLIKNSSVSKEPLSVSFIG